MQQPHQSRWWNQHDKRPAATNPSPHHQACHEKQQQQQQQQQPAPGFGKTTSQAPPDLPKVWEYEDPLKDVHGPFDAAQIINWFAQDWFGLDLKLRRRGNYWTTLEFVLDELKAEARGTAVLTHGGYDSTPPQQAARAVTTNTAAGAGGGGSSTATISSSGSSFAPAGRQAGNAPNAWGDSGDGWASTRAPAAGAGSSSSSRNAAAMPERGVVLGADGKWERGIIIGGAERSARRAGGCSAASTSNCDYRCGNDHGDRAGNGGGGAGGGGGSSTGQARRERGGRRSGAAGTGSLGDAGGGYDRASRILQGDDDDEYGARRSRSRPHAAVAGRKAASTSSRPVASADSWPATAEEQASPAAAAKAAAAQGEAAAGAAQEADDASAGAAAAECRGAGGACLPLGVPPASVPALPGVKSASPAILSQQAEQPSDAPLSGVKALIAQREQAVKLHSTPCSTPPRFTTPPRSPPVTTGGAAAAPVTVGERRAGQGSRGDAPAEHTRCEDGESLVRSITTAMFVRLQMSDGSEAQRTTSDLP